MGNIGEHIDSVCLRGGGREREKERERERERDRNRVKERDRSYYQIVREHASDSYISG